MEKTALAVIMFAALTMSAFCQELKKAWWYEGVSELRAKFPEKELNLSKEKLSLPIAFNGNMKYMNIPIDQKNQGCCVAASGAQVLGALKAKEKGWNPKVDEHAPSPAFSYNLCRSPYGPGIATSTFFNLTTTEGCAMRSDMPFNPDDDTTLPSMSVRYKGLEWRFNSWGYCFDRATAKAKLLDCSIMGFNRKGTHAFAIVGYNDTIRFGNKIGAFYYLNSAGPNWGENGGYAWISYEDADTVFYFAENRPSVFPELVLEIKSNLHYDNMYMLGPYKIVHYAFVKDSDTLKNFSYIPENESFLLALDRVQEASGANQLVIESEFDFWANWNMPIPLAMEVYEVSVVTPDGYASPMTVYNNRFDSVLDSVKLGSSVRREYYSKLVAKASLNPVSTPEIEPNIELSVAPNPIKGQANLSFSLQENSEVNLAIYDLSGRCLATLLSGRMAAGNHRISWATDLPPGLYFAKFSVAKKITTKKILIAQ